LYSATSRCQGDKSHTKYKQSFSAGVRNLLAGVRNLLAGVHNLLAIAGRITFIFMNYGRQ